MYHVLTVQVHQTVQHLPDAGRSSSGFRVEDLGCSGFRITGYGLRVTGYGFRTEVTGYGLQVTGYRLRTELTGWDLGIRDYDFFVEWCLVFSV